MDNFRLRLMKNRFSAREIALVLVPALALGGFAWFSQRAEKNTPRGLYVEKSELVPATPLDVSRGTSHYLKVTLNYGGPRPSWWMKKEAYNNYSFTTPSTFTWLNQFGTEFRNRKRTFAVGDELVGKRGEKPVVLKETSRYAANIGEGEDRYEVSHPIALSQVPLQAGQVTFRGIYALRELKPLRWEKVIRQAGKLVQWNTSRAPGGKITFLQARFDSTSRLTPEYRYDIALDVIHSKRPDGQARRVERYDLELVDRQGHVFKPDNVNVFIHAGGTHPHNGSEVGSANPITVHIKRSYAMQEPLTLRGKISINDQWPFPFSVKLPPR